MLRALLDFVVSYQGIQLEFVEFPLIQMENVYEGTNAFTNIFVPSYRDGADPTFN